MSKPDPLEYIRDTYQVPAYLGVRIRFCPREGGAVDEGVICGSHNAHLKVKMDVGGGVCFFHPTWNITYILTERLHVKPD